MTIEELKQVKHGSVVHKKGSQYYAVLLGIFSYETLTLCCVRVKENDFSEDKIFTKIKTSKFGTISFDSLYYSDFELIQKDFTSTILKLQMIMPEHRMLNATNEPFYKEFRMVFCKKDLRPLRSYYIIRKDSSRTDINHVCNGDGTFFDNTTNLIKQISLPDNFIAIEQGGINPDRYGSGIEAGNIFSYQGGYLIILKKHYTKFVVAIIPKGKFISLENCFADRTIMSKRELSRCFMEIDAFSMPLMKLFVKYEDKLKDYDFSRY